MSHEVINIETRLTFQFLGICSAEFRYSFVCVCVCFNTICLENTFSFFGQISIYTAVVTEQTKMMMQITNAIDERKFVVGIFPHVWAALTSLKAIFDQ